MNSSTLPGKLVYVYMCAQHCIYCDSAYVRNLYYVKHNPYVHTYSIHYIYTLTLHLLYIHTYHYITYTLVTYTLYTHSYNISHYTLTIHISYSYTIYTILTLPIYTT